VTSSFFAGEIASYTPSVYELALGVGGVAVALIATGLATKVLRILPTNLADKNLEG
jgi:molybdopterin-containing oxidoreductase family membrane subunit